VKDNRNRNLILVAASKEIRRATLTCKSGGLALSDSTPASPQSLNLLKAKGFFPFFYGVVKTLSGRWARRVFLTILLLLMVISTASRLRAYLLARKIEAVLHGLSVIRLDETTEEELRKMIPFLTEKDWKGPDFSYRSYYVHISNDSDGLPWPYGLTHSYALAVWLGRIGELLGYRYISFDASLLVQDGKVTQADYGLANQWMRPQAPGYVGYIVTARSVHGFWLPGNLGVSSVDDYSPQYRLTRWGSDLAVIYSDASPVVTKRIFDLDLSCFWGLHGCTDAAEIAPQISQDVETIQKATYRQLISEKCPDSIIEGRMRYLPDMSVLLLEVTGSRRLEVNEEGGKVEDWFTDYNLKEAIRGKSFGSWKNVRFQRTIPSPTDPTRQIANQIWPETKIGQEVLYFGGLGFYSCRFIPATRSALDIVRNSPIPAKRPEDQIPRGLQ
jgi:hypothetical protein